LIRTHLTPLLAIAALSAALAGPMRAQSGEPGIDHQNRLLQARARVSGKTDGIVLLLTREGAVSSVVERLPSVGAEVLARFDDVGYLRVRLPLDRLAAVRSMPEVLDAQIDEGFLSYGYAQGTDPAATKSLEQFGQRFWGKPDSAGRPLPPVPEAARGAAGRPNPYVPMADMGITRFVREHPTYDGRGVTIGVLENGVLDLAHPTLQLGRTLGGDSTAKVVGIITPASYNRDETPARIRSTLTRDTLPDPYRVRATGPIEGGEGAFRVGGVEYRVPQPGRFSFGLFAGYPTTAANPYAVLWNATGQVWVDTDRDGDFRNETPLEDFNRTGATGHLKGDSADSKPRPLISFAVAFDSGGTNLRLYPGVADHQTMVASVAAGHGILGGATDASAPAARIVVVNAGESLGDDIEGFIRAARDPWIDLITNSQTGERFPSTGESIIGIVLERLVRRYRKPIFAAADNSGPMLGLPMEPSTAPGVISVGGYASRESYRVHYAWELAAPDWILPYSARGPARNGEMKPDLLAPVLSIAAHPCGTEPWLDPGLVYKLPDCYMLAGGTSSATPHAAGAAAALISAAKQARIPWDASRIAWALRSGARTLPGYGIHEQGSGLIDIGRAWDLLRSHVEVPEIQVAAPIRTTIARYLRHPGVGPGLFEREGWAPGDTGSRIITLTRTSGRPRIARYGLRWRGNDGTFSVGSGRVTLPLGKPVEVMVRIAPRDPGVHSASLDIIDQPSGVAVHQVLVTVVAAHQLTAENGYRARLSGAAPWPREVPFFVRVPSGTTVLRAELRVKGGRAVLQYEDPGTWENLAWNSYFKPSRYPLAGIIPILPGRSGIELIPSPEPGVWEFSVQTPRQQGDSLEYRVPIEVELVITALGAGAEQVGTGAAAGIGFVNRMASLPRAGAVVELGARRMIADTTDSTGAGPMHIIDVVPGTTTLRVDVAPTAPHRANPDLYLFDCTAGDCFLWDAVIGAEAPAALLVRAPRIGSWKVVIDPVGAARGTAYRYTEILTNPAYGAAQVLTAPALRSTGAAWTDSVSVSPSGAIPKGRELVSVADLVDHALEAEEQARPLAVFAGVPYRPVVIATVVVPVGRVE
jgi:subtilisin family serine protease